MMRALWSAASGMIAEQTNMDVISHNIANVNTYGNKKVRAEFQDLLYQTVRAAGADSGQDNMYPTGLQVGLGTRVATTNRIFTQGAFQSTDNPTDLAISGDGFFRIILPDGTEAYTRDGSFKIDATNTRLVTSDGYELENGDGLDANASIDSLVIASDGTKSETVDGEQGQIGGQIRLYRFINPSGLQSIGKNLFLETEASGDPIENDPGTNGTGTIVQGVLEMSSVQIVEEMVNMIISQRAYESNSKAVTTSDSMLEIANQLKR